MYSTYAFAKKSPDASFEKITIQRNEPGEDDVQFDIGMILFLHVFNKDLIINIYACS